MDGQKVIGSAQLRLGGGRAFLQHGSILLGGSQDLLAAVSLKPQAASGGTTLSAVLGRPVTFQEVADAIVAAWDAPLTSTVLYRLLPPSTAHYSDPAWTWRR